MTYSAEQIKAILPHRAPFLFVDTVELIDIGKVGRATINFSHTAEFWSGDLAVQTSADYLLLEAAAQIFGVVLASGMQDKDRTNANANAEDKHLLLGFDNCRLSDSFICQQDVCIDVQLDGVFGSMYKGSFIARQNDDLVGSGELTVMQGEA